MKKIIVLTIASLVSVAAVAQTSPRTRFGLKAGVSLPKYQFKNVNGTDPDTRTTTTFHITGYADAPLSSYFSVQPGVSLQGKGGKFQSGTFTTEQNTFWIEIPVNFVAKFPIAEGTGTGLFLGAGPYAGFGISGKNKTESALGTSKTDVAFGNASSDNLKSTDFGVNFIGGFEMGSGFTLGAGYGFGLTDLRPGGSGGNGKTTNRVLTFSIGALF